MKHIFLKLVSNNHSSFQKAKQRVQNRQSLKTARKIAHSILDETDSKNINALNMSEMLDIPLFELEDVLKGKSVLNEGLINKLETDIFNNYTDSIIGDFDGDVEVKMVIYKNSYMSLYDIVGTFE